MDKSKVKLEDKLKKAGHSVTQSRRVIFGLLENADVPMGISEIVSESPTTDRATVYRTIELFEELGIVKRVWFGFKSKVELSDEYDSHHHHLVCEKCGKIQKIDSGMLEKTVSKLTRKFNYTPTKHHVEIFGLCEDHQIQED